MSIRLFTTKDKIHTDLRTFHAQFWGKGSQYREEDSENKILSQKEYITGKNVKIIEIIFQFSLPAGCECTGTPIALLA